MHRRDSETYSALWCTCSLSSVLPPCLTPRPCPRGRRNGVSFEIYIYIYIYILESSRALCARSILLTRDNDYCHGQDPRVTEAISMSVKAERTTLARATKQAKSHTEKWTTKGKTEKHTSGNADRQTDKRSSTQTDRKIQRQKGKRIYRPAHAQKCELITELSDFKPCSLTARHVQL